MRIRTGDTGACALAYLHARTAECGAPKRCGVCLHLLVHARSLPTARPCARASEPMRCARTLHGRARVRPAGQPSWVTTAGPRPRGGYTGVRCCCVASSHAQPQNPSRRAAHRGARGAWVATRQQQSAAAPFRTASVAQRPGPCLRNLPRPYVRRRRLTGWQRPSRICASWQQHQGMATTPAVVCRAVYQQPRADAFSAWPTMPGHLPDPREARQDQRPVGRSAGARRDTRSPWSRFPGAITR